PRVRGMKLTVEPLVAEEGVNLVDAFGDDQARALVAFGNEISQRPADRPGHPHDLSLLMHQGELAVDFADPVGVSGPDSFEGFGLLKVEKHIGRRIDEIYEPFDDSNLVHGKLRSSIAENCGK